MAGQTDQRDLLIELLSTHPQDALIEVDGLLVPCANKASDNVVCQGILCNNGLVLLGLAHVDMASLISNSTVSSTPLNRIAGAAGAAISYQADADMRSALARLIDDYAKARSEIESLPYPEKVLRVRLQTLFLSKCEIASLSIIDGTNVFRTEIGDIVWYPQLFNATRIDSGVVEKWLTTTRDSQNCDQVSIWTPEKVMLYLLSRPSPLLNRESPQAQSSAIDGTLIGYLPDMLRSEDTYTQFLQGLSAEATTPRVRALMDALIASDDPLTQVFVKRLIQNKRAAQRSKLRYCAIASVLAIGLALLGWIRMRFWQAQLKDDAGLWFGLAFFTLVILLPVAMPALSEYRRYSGYEVADSTNCNSP